MPKVGGEHKSKERERLVQAAWQVFRREGNDTTTEAVLSEAGMSEPELRRHFPSTETLVNTAILDRINETVAVVAADGEPGETDRSLLVRFIVEVLRRPARTPELVAYRGRVLDDERTRATLAEVNRMLVERFAPLVSAAQASGELEAGWDPEAIVELVDILVEGINRRHFSDTFATSLQRVGDSAISLLLGGLLVPEQQRRG
ncbi:MAG: TetR/AcrR family transcriptional regulator [Acidimicrobiales bacterium]